MKLQRNNKYAKRLTSGLGTAILSASILVGCSSNSNKMMTLSEETVEATPEETVVKDRKYFTKYYKLSEEEIENELCKYDIKYPNSIWRMSQISSIVIKDSDDNLKVDYIIERRNLEKNTIDCYDLFTEEFMFTIPDPQNVEVSYTTEITNYDFSNLENAIPYFDDKEIVEYGVCCYATLFVTNHIDYLREKDGIDYIDPKNFVYKMFYPIEFKDADLIYSLEKIAKSYIVSVPKEYRITSKELGLVSTYIEERKYADFWKISDEEVNETIEEMDMLNENMIYRMSNVKSLVLKDENNQYKVLNLTLSKENNMLKFYDLYSEEYLFSLNQDGLTNVDNVYFDADFSKVNDAIPYFNDKEFIKLYPCVGSNNFVYNYLDELSKRDGINYEEPDDAFFVFFYPTGDFLDRDLKYTKREIAECYVKSVPYESQVNLKDLKMENNKVLTK